MRAVVKPQFRTIVSIRSHFSRLLTSHLIRWLCEACLRCCVAGHRVTSRTTKNLATESDEGTGRKAAGCDVSLPDACIAITRPTDALVVLSFAGARVCGVVSRALARAESLSLARLTGPVGKTPGPCPVRQPSIDPLGLE